MIYKESFNSDIYVLILIRPADSLCATLSSFLSQQQYRFSVCSSVYRAISELETISENQPVVLVSRPVMLVSQAALFLSQRFSNLRMIGWLDSNENASDCAITQATGSGMAVVSHCDQLQQVIQTFCRTGSQKSPVSDTNRAEMSAKIDRLEYELCDDEINALLGAQ